MPKKQKQTSKKIDKPNNDSHPSYIDCTNDGRISEMCHEGKKETIGDSSGESIE